MDIILFILILLLVVGLIGFLSLGLQAWGVSLHDFFTSTRLMLLGVELTLISLLIADSFENLIIKGILTALGIAIFFSGFIKVDREKSSKVENSGKNTIDT